ncbi:MAG: hypothetical protein U0165_07545 [Polyangiaceae bacterium]
MAVPVGGEVAALPLCLSHVALGSSTARTRVALAGSGGVDLLAWIVSRFFGFCLVRAAGAR